MAGRTVKTLADDINDAGAENYGAAGREWIKWLAANQQQAARPPSSKTTLASLIPQSYGSRCTAFQTGLRLSRRRYCWECYYGLG